MALNAGHGKRVIIAVMRPFDTERRAVLRCCQELWDIGFVFSIGGAQCAAQFQLSGILLVHRLKPVNFDFKRLSFDDKLEQERFRGFSALDECRKIDRCRVFLPGRKRLRRTKFQRVLLRPDGCSWNIRHERQRGHGGGLIELFKRGDVIREFDLNNACAGNFPGSVRRDHDGRRKARGLRLRHGKRSQQKAKQQD